MKLKINGIEWLIDEVDGTDSRLTVNSACCFGTTHFRENAIYLHQALKDDAKKRVLIHELSHAFISEFLIGETSQFNDEQLCDFVANYSQAINDMADAYFSKKAKPISS